MARTAYNAAHSCLSTGRKGPPGHRGGNRSASRPPLPAAIPPHSARLSNAPKSGAWPGTQGAEPLRSCQRQLKIPHFAPVEDFQPALTPPSHRGGENTRCYGQPWPTILSSADSRRLSSPEQRAALRCLVVVRTRSRADCPRCPARRAAGPPRRRELLATFSAVSIPLGNAASTRRTAARGRGPQFAAFSALRQQATYLGSADDVGKTA